MHHRPATTRLIFRKDIFKHNLPEEEEEKKECEFANYNNNNNNKNNNNNNNRKSSPLMRFNSSESSSDGQNWSSIQQSQSQSLLTEECNDDLENESQSLLK